MLFINYDEVEESFIASIYLELENGIMPFKRDRININHLPNLCKKLIDGETLYIDLFDCYLGKERFEGPYCEDKVFSCDYESHNSDLSELIIDIEKNIKSGKTSNKELVKIGDYYRLV